MHHNISLLDTNKNQFRIIQRKLIAIVATMIKAPAISGFYQLAILLPSIAVGVRRMHDTDNSGWHLLTPIYGFYLCFIAGSEGENRFGPDPKSPPNMPRSQQHMKSAA